MLKSKFNLGLDAKDIAILRELDKNVRVSSIQIGKKTRLSKEVVQYRIKRLEDNKIITGYWAIINSAPAFAYKILIKNKNLAKEKRQEFIDYVTKHKRVSWFANTEGNFDYIITVFAKDDVEFSDFCEKLFSLYGSYFQERHILKTTTASITNEKYLYEKGDFLYNWKFEISKGIEPDDETEEKILREISLNSRAKFTEIAEKVNLTPEAVAHRFKKIIKKKLILGLKVRLDFNKLNLEYYHFFIRLQDQTKKKELISYYTMHPDCNSILQHIGCYDLHLEFILPKDKIQCVLDDFISKFGTDVASYELLHIREEYILKVLK